MPSSQNWEVIEQHDPKDHQRPNKKRKKENLVNNDKYGLNPMSFFWYWK